MEARVFYAINENLKGYIDYTRMIVCSCKAKNIDEASKKFIDSGKAIDATIFCTKEYFDTYLKK
jgi:hypothetical protein